MPQTTLPDVSIPAEIEQFCIQHGLLSELHTAMQIADEVFGPIKRWAFEIDVDVEAGIEKLAIDIDVPLDVEESLRRRERFTRRWMGSATPEAADCIVVLTNPT